MNTKDISELSTISINLSNVSTSNLANVYSKYSTFLEHRLSEDEPEEFRYTLYDLFDAGIDTLPDFNDDIIISEPISSNTQILCDKNYDIIKSEQFGVVNDVIEYDSINNFARELSCSTPSSHSSSDICIAIYNWLNTLPGINFDINTNPENADNSNLVLTQKMKNDIQNITESILNKIFRNLMQFVRVNHDYRLYGKNATILGGTSTELSSSQKVGKWSGLPNSCWKEYTSNYIVGKTNYNESLTNVGDVIKNPTYDISPYTSYGIAPHVHNVEIDMQNLPSEFSISRNVVKISGTPNYRVFAGHSYNEDKPLILWNEQAKNHLLDEPKGFVDIDTLTGGAIISSMSWSYAWSSNSYCQLIEPTNSNSNIFNKNKITLPTYETYVWKWNGNDSTNITTPTAYLKPE